MTRNPCASALGTRQGVWSLGDRQRFPPPGRVVADSPPMGSESVREEGWPRGSAARVLCKASGPFQRPLHAHLSDSQTPRVWCLWLGSPGSPRSPFCPGAPIGPGRVLASPGSPLSPVGPGKPGSPWASTPVEGGQSSDVSARPRQADFGREGAVTHWGSGTESRGGVQTPASRAARVPDVIVVGPLLRLQRHWGACLASIRLPEPPGPGRPPAPPPTAGVVRRLAQDRVPGDPGKPLVPGKPCNPLMPRTPGKPVWVPLGYSVAGAQRRFK